MALIASAVPARAEVVKFDVSSTDNPALQGRAFGSAGTAQKITGRATIALDPADPKNAVIADLALAPRNAQGRVEAVTDVVILRPQHPNGTLLFEVLNRGRKLLTGWTQDTDAPTGIRLEQATDAGNGFLLEQGYTLVWAGWQADSPVSPGALRIEVSTVAGVTGPSLEQLYPTPDAYVGAVRAVAGELVHSRLLLPQDAAAAAEAARAGTLAKLGKTSD